MEKRKNNETTSRDNSSADKRAGIIDIRRAAKLRRKQQRILLLVLYIAVILIVYMAQAHNSGETLQQSCRNADPFATSVVSGTDMVIHVIDVGQGDCTLVQGGGVNILIDAGENGFGDMVTDYLLSNRLFRIDMMICTHPHSDHIGGCDTVLDEPLINVKQVLMPEIPDELIPVTRTYEDVLDAIDREGCELRFIGEDTTLTFGNMTLYIFTPFSYPHEQPISDLNDYSLCTRFECGDVSFLCCGDLTSAGEKLLLSRHTSENGPIGSTILKISHHGSRYSSSREFIEAVSPDHAFISVGRNNDFGHPSKDVLDILDDMRIKYDRTDEHGSFIYRCGGGAVSTARAA